MIVPIDELLAELRKEPKFYLCPELGMRSFYRARSGQPLSAQTKEVFLLKARASRWPEATGLRLLDGSTYYGSALLAEMAETIAAQCAEIERLQRLVWRHVKSGAPFHHGDS